MGNFSIKEDLLKLKGAFITNFKGRTETKRCLVIPVDDSGLYVGEKGVYLNLTAIEMENPQYKETHCIKQSLDKEIYEALSEEQRQSLPIIGGMRPLVKKAAPQMNVLIPVANPATARELVDLALLMREIGRAHV